ncbi:hypothetical protein PENSPDRAFT_691298 [Peniophora sp. CONT]|nr:hypothetical protein PENSPDRAFT_691298 [Peniophora sp. CONT]
MPVDKESVSQFTMPRARARAVANSEALAPTTHQQPVAEAFGPPPITPVPEHIPRSSEGPSRSSSATPRSASPAISTPAPNAQGKAKKRPKNKSGLQELLARKKQADTARTATPTNALSSFLSEL